MDTQQDAAGADRRGVPTFAVDAVVALILLVLGLVVVTASAKLGAGWTSDGPGSGYFPFYLGIILCLASVSTLYQAICAATPRRRKRCRGMGLIGVIGSGSIAASPLARYRARTCPRETISPIPRP